MKEFERTAKQMGDQMRNIPHIVIGKNKPQQNQTAPYRKWKIDKQKEYFQGDPIDNQINNFKKYGLIAVVLLIAGYAAYRIIKIILFGG